MERRNRVSASMIYYGLKRDDRPDRYIIPTFSYRGGVVLRPQVMKLNCAYGVDGAIDYGNTGFAQEHCENDSDDSCIPGCGAPPDWCDRDTPVVDGWCHCGFNWCSNQPPRPWRPQDLAVMLEKGAEVGDAFKGVNTFTGYNELVLDADAWLDGLPHSIEAFILVDPAACAEDRYNQRRSPVREIRDQPATKAKVASTEGALDCVHHRREIERAHRDFMREYALDEDTGPPLLTFFPHRWDSPFGRYWPLPS